MEAHKKLEAQNQEKEVSNTQQINFTCSSISQATITNTEKKYQRKLSEMKEVCSTF